MVYADLLSTQGDERGEFICLQIERAKSGASPSRREQALLKKHHKTWLGPLDGFVTKSGFRFARGFLAHVEAKGPWKHLRYRDLLKSLTGDPMWATVETLYLPSLWQPWLIQDIHRLICHPIMGNLRSLHRIRAPNATALDIAEPTGLEELGVMLENRIEPLGAGPGLSTLKTLYLYIVWDPNQEGKEDLWRWPIMDRLEHLALGANERLKAQQFLARAEKRALGRFPNAKISVPFSL